MINCYWCSITLPLKKKTFFTLTANFYCFNRNDTYGVNLGGTLTNFHKLPVAK